MLEAETEFIKRQALYVKSQQQKIPSGTAKKLSMKEEISKKI